MIQVKVLRELILTKQVHQESATFLTTSMF